MLWLGLKVLLPPIVVAAGLSYLVASDRGARVPRWCVVPVYFFCVVATLWLSMVPRLGRPVVRIVNEGGQAVHVTIVAKDAEWHSEQVGVPAGATVSELVRMPGGAESFELLVDTELNAHGRPTLALVSGLGEVVTLRIRGAREVASSRVAFGWHWRRLTSRL